jgi:GNAT superfamily N-acetyltransferase
MAAELGAFGPPSWRTAEEIVDAEVRTLTAHFSAPVPGAEVLVVGREDGEPLGFAFVETVTDYFTGERHGHVGMLAVGRAHQGMGAGRALMCAAELWARERGFRRLSLNGFARNERARAVYERLGYEAETLRYVKAVTPDTAS